MLVVNNDIAVEEWRGNPDKGWFLKKLLGNSKIRFQTKTSMVSTGFGMPVSPLIQAAHVAFSRHLPLKIEPAHFWVTIIQEVATMVKLNPAKFAGVFHGDPANKKTIKVRCDELLLTDSAWPTAIAMFREALAEETGSELVEGFFPHFFNDDETRELAYLVSAMDAASPYFKYEVWSLCGIPEYHIEGTPQDWISLFDKVYWLESVFGASPYFLNLKTLLSKIVWQVSTGNPDLEFWRNYYKYSEMSGTETINGWITNLYAHVVTSEGPLFKPDFGKNEYETNMFPSGLSVVAFDWVVYGEPHPMRFFSGMMGLEFENGVVTPSIGYGVIEGEK